MWVFPAVVGRGRRISGALYLYYRYYYYRWMADVVLRCRARDQRSCVVVGVDGENIAAAADAGVSVGQLGVRACKCCEVSARWD